MARWLLPLTCAFGCPLLMGAMMWGLGRNGERHKLEREVRRLNRGAGLATAPRQPVARRLGTGTRRVWCSACVNWKVVAAVVAVGVALAVVSPRLFASVGPGLLVLICPVSMLITMVAMGRSRRAAPSATSESSSSIDTESMSDVAVDLRTVEAGPVVDRSTVST